MAAATYVVLEAVAAVGFEPSYSYSADYISDLGRDGSRWALAMQTGFVVQGLLFFAGAVLVVGRPATLRARLFLGLVAANAVGNILIALVHHGPVHVLGAALAIVGGNAAIALGWGGRHRTFSLVMGVAGLLSLAVLLLGGGPPGVWERGSVYSITLWQLVSGTLLLRGR